MQKLRKSVSDTPPEKMANDNGAEDVNVLQVARRVAATIGADFFQAIAKHLAKSLKADCVLIGEFAGGHVERVRSLGAYLDGQPVTFEYELAGSASAQIAQGRHALYRSDVQTRFPNDTLLPRVRAQACIGLPLTNPKGKPLGLMMALYRRPVTTLRTARSMLEIFSSRAAAELSRKREDDDLRESEQRHRAFIARNPDAMWRIEFEQPIDVTLPEEEQLERLYQYGYVAEANDALARLAGVEKGERLIGSRLEELIPRSDPSIREANLLAIRSGHSFSSTETNWIDRQGNRRHLIRSQWGIVEDGKLQRVWGITRDITDLKRSERALDASEQRMVDLLESVSLAVVIVDRADIIIFCNHYMHKLGGWEVGETTGKNWLDLMIPEEEHERLRGLFASAASDPEQPIRFQSTVASPDGRRWLFDWDRMVLRNGEGRIIAWANLGRDVTAHRALEEHFRQSQKLASIGRVAGGVAHDFNNLLTVILGYSSALLENRDPADPVFGGLTEIRKAAAKGAELTHRLLAFGRRQVLRPELLNVNTLIQDSEQMLGRLIGEQVRLSSRLDPSIGLVRVDPGSFHQVMMNLAVNARDAMPDGGDLTITTSNETVEFHGPFSPAVPPGEYVQIAFADTGIGMNEETRSHLFEPFYTTKARGRGTGLGLATVYGIVQQSGGRIMIETEEGKGTTVRIFLPRIAAEPAYPGESAPPHVRVPGTSDTILLVEDREDVRRVTANILLELGYTVLQADDQARALDLIQDHTHRIDLLLTDVVMPGVGGVELSTLIKSHRPGVRVLLMSGSVIESDVAEKLSQTGAAFIQKPFTPEELSEQIHKLLSPE